MAAQLIDLHTAHAAASDDLSGLQACVAAVIGEPFQFARVSYGDELTLHFGALRPARSAKLTNRMYGSYILGLRASPWFMKDGPASHVMSADYLTGAYGTPLRTEDIETHPLITPGSRVMAATAFVVQPAGGFGLHLAFSDGSSLIVRPAPPDDEPDDTLPEVADWELLSRGGVLKAGPGLNWTFELSKPHREPNS